MGAAVVTPISDNEVVATAPVPHGTASGYSYHRCRCDECRAYKSAACRSYYERKIGRPVRTKMTDEERRAKEVARARAWEKANPEKRKAQRASYRDRNREKLRRQSRERFQRLMRENPEKVRAQRNAWAKTPQGRLSYRNAQEMRRRGAPYTAEALEWIASLVDPNCVYCGVPATEIDHLIPISRGGSGERDNLAPSCRSCNASKGVMTADEFRKERSRPNGR